jgi:hypothetical protein
MAMKKKGAAAPKENKSKTKPAGEPTELAPPQYAGDRMPPSEILEGLAKIDDWAKSTAGDATAERGAALKEAKDKYGVDNVSWGMAARFRRMALKEPVLARSRWNQFLYIIEALGVENLMAAELPGLEAENTPIGTRQHKGDAPEEPQTTVDAMGDAIDADERPELVN